MFFANFIPCAIIEDMQEPEMTTKMSNRQRSFLGVGLAIVLATAAFFSGLHVGQGKEIDARLEAGLFSLFTSEARSEAERKGSGSFHSVATSCHRRWRGRRLFCRTV